MHEFGTVMEGGGEPVNCRMVYCGREGAKEGCWKKWSGATI